MAEESIRVALVSFMHQGRMIRKGTTIRAGHPDFADVEHLLGPMSVDHEHTPASGKHGSKTDK